MHEDDALRLEGDRATHKALQESGELYRSLFDNMLNGLAYCKMLFENGRPLDFIYLEVNSAFETLTGLKNAVGRRVSDVIPNIQQLDPELFEIFGRVALTGSPERFEKHIEAMDMWFSISVYSPAREHFVAVFDVITERKQAEATRERAQEKLRASETKYRDLHESMRDAYVEVDLDGRLIEFNREYLSMLGYTADELRKLTYQELTPQKWHAMEAEIVEQQIMKRGHSDVYEKEYCRKDGTVFPVELRAFLLRDPSGKPVNIWKIVRDITPRKAIEATLHKAFDDLARSNKELEQFAYVASHDLQEPLRMVASYTQLLAERYEGQLDEKAKKYIDYAVDGALRMQQLIQDLLTYSRLHSQAKPPEPVEVQWVFDQVLKNLQVAIEESGALATSDELPTVRADAGQLLQVFQNLMANALKFRCEGIPRVHVSAQEFGEHWRFSVQDNGIGIEAQYADRVFVIFQRLHTRQEYPGTGIGLAICKRIVLRHGGKIWFESEPGKGATFFFTLPK